MNRGFNNIDVVILCGGKGERLAEVLPDTPKPMAEVDGRPFLDILISYLGGFGFRRFILCTGHKGSIIEDYYKNNSSYQIVISQEEQPLGTGGAVKNAAQLIKSNPFLVMNGDSLCRLNLEIFFDFHTSKGALLSIALVASSQSGDYGSITVDDSDKIMGFNEKAHEGGANIINAGVYIFDQKILSLMPEGDNFSLEYDFFPACVSRRFYGQLTESAFVDIGTPSRYAALKKEGI